MRMLLFGLSLLSLAAASGCAGSRTPAETNQNVAVHACTNNLLLRGTGVFGGTQPEIFLSGPNLRREPPPARSELTLVLDVT